MFSGLPSFLDAPCPCELPDFDAGMGPPPRHMCTEGLRCYRHRIILPSANAIAVVRDFYQYGADEVPDA